MLVNEKVNMGENIGHREFQSYEEYVYAQGGKARGNRDKLLKNLGRNMDSFAKVFKAAKLYLKPGPVLCLGARTGAESLGAVRAGFKRSVGIDLHPVGPTVLKGDWHELDFPSASFANIYSNSLDHCLHLDKLTSEVKRILEPGGKFYVMATNREGNNVEDWLAKGGNEALFWKTSDDLANAICGYGFKVERQWRDGKWGHYILSVLD